MKLFDSHAHYNDEKFDEDREEILRQIKKFGVEKLVIVGYNLDSSKMAINLAENDKDTYAIVRYIS